MVHRIGDKVPDVAGALFIAWNAEVAGEVSLGTDSSVWFSATLRADLAAIRIGRGTNVQDGATLHVDTGVPCVVGDGVVIGHNAVLHACDVGDECLIGMGAVVLSGARIGAQSVVGAGALVTEGKTFPPRSLIVGNPARALRAVDDTMVERIRAGARSYVRLAAEASGDYRETELSLSGS